MTCSKKNSYAFCTSAVAFITTRVSGCTNTNNNINIVITITSSNGSGGGGGGGGGSGVGNQKWVIN